MAQRQFRSDDTSPWFDKFSNGSAGALTVSANTTDGTQRTTLTGTASGMSATVGSGTGFSNNDLVLIHQTQGTGAGNWELNKVTAGATTTSWTLTYPLMNTYATGAQVQKLSQYTSVTVNSGITYTGAAWNGLSGGIIAILARDSITVDGSIDVTSKGFRSPSRIPTSGGTGLQGEGVSGGGSNNTATNGNGGGGGGGGSAPNSGGGAGGGGGNASAGSNGGSGGSGSSGLGGLVAGTSSLQMMVFGGSGGAGGCNAVDANRGGAGGGSGGIVILISKRITLGASALIAANGMSGLTAYDAGGGGGGAGAGGSILLKGQRIILGTNLVTCSPGAGVGAGSGGGGAGGSASVGRIHVDYSVSLTGTASPTIDSTLDPSLVDNGGSFIFNIL